MTPKYVQPALLGGLVMGVLSALPIINIANCCCLWVISGGVVASYLMQSSYPRPIAAGDGAVAGLLAGVFGAVAWLFFTIPIDLLMGPVQRELFRRLLENAQDVPDSMRTLVDSMASGTVTGLRYLIGFVVWLFVGAIFSTLGGLLGVVLFKKKEPPASSGAVDFPSAPPSE